MMLIFLVAGRWYNFMLSLRTYIFFKVWGSIYQSDSQILKYNYTSRIRQRAPPAGGGILSRVRASGRDGEPVPWGICWYRDRAGLVDGGEGCRVAGFCVHLGWDGVSTPTERLRRPAEVPPVGVWPLCRASPWV